jgi:serine/threonine protein kinase
VTTSSATSGPPPGLTVGGYELLARIGEGGMGVVHLARQPGGERVALKVIRPHFVGDDESRERLAREVKSLSRIRSGRVAAIIDADPWGEIPFVATRYVPGLSLTEHVAQYGPITGGDLTWLAWCLAEALSDVHACGVLHRDIKPSNVLMEGRSPILIDFGLARVADDPKLTHTGWLLGTPGYLAPEILHGHDATVASDVHSWAATVAYAGLGRSPFGTGPSMAIMDRVRRGEHDLDGLPEPLRGQVTAALNPDPALRPTLPTLLSGLRRQVGGPPMGKDASPAFLRDPLPETMPLSVYRAPPSEADPAAAPTVAQPAGPLSFLDDHGHLAPATRLLHDEEPERDDDEPAPEPEKPRAAERLRRGLLLLLGTVAIGLATAAFPYFTVLALMLTVWLLRSLSLTATAASERRRLRGAKWYDAPLALLSGPWHVLAALAGSVMLVLWSLGIALAAALIGYAFALDAISTLVLGGAAFAVSLWLGPGGSRVRGPVRRVTDPLSRSFGTWLLGVVLVLAMAGFAAYLLSEVGIDWRPAGPGPLAEAQQWPDWLPR